VNLQALSEVLPADSVSRKNGDKTGFSYCGKRQFRITSSGHENFLAYNDLRRELTLLSSNKRDQGELTVTLEAYLVDYEEVKVSTTFKTVVNECKVVALNSVA
jgi:hypothetical protein